jgi:sulfite reductase (NADPH) flavoprotein alpha-component
MARQLSHSYNRANPFLATIKERYCLCKPGSDKKTYHIVLDLSGSGIDYEVGDSIGIYPQNDPMIVERNLQAMKANGNEEIWDKRTEKTWRLRDFLTTQANLVEVSRKLVKEISERQSNPIKKEFLTNLHTEENKEALKAYLQAHELWDLLEEHKEVIFALQELCDLLMPALPRLYSIASSHKMVGNEVHLTVAYLEYVSNGHLRRGTCTHYLCEIAPMHIPAVPVYIQAHHGFTLPADPSSSVIMIGPGTGVAPFRAFMQERIVAEATGKNWLFFGERNRTHTYFYESFWQELSDQGKLRLDLAFSRDQAHKVYVQHRMHDQGEELFRWIEEGAYLYVCGDASRMAKDVEAALIHIIQKHGNHDETNVKQYLKKLRAEKRYLRDVY